MIQLLSNGVSYRLYRIGWKKIAVGVLKQWHEKQFVGRWARKRIEMCIWTEILEALLKRDW